MEHPAVTEACVVAVSDEKMGNKVRAFVCLKPGHSRNPVEFDEELKAFLRQRIAAYKIPKEIEIIEEIPKTITGKIKRSQLRSASKTA